MADRLQVASTAERADKPIASAVELTSSPIADFFAGRHVLITGSTGFMGKVLVEKLLRSCPGVGKIYLLMREKRGKDARTRHQEYVNHIVFNRLRAERPSFVAQLQPVSGDVQLEGLGLSAADHAQLLENVEVVFHCAANVRFDQPLGMMVNMNAGGALRLLQLAERMTKLMSYVHVSTSYCHCYLDVLEEKIYPNQTDPHKLMETLEWMNDDIIKAITPKLISGFPNTYSYSKNLAEHIVDEYGSKFPIGIARPSIVTNAWREPMPGWVESLNGPMGLLVGAGKGVVRSMHCKPDANAELMPVDIAINIVIALAWQVAITRPATPLVVNVTESGDNPITWDQMIERGRTVIKKYPFSECIWYPGGSIKRSKLVHNFCVVFFHFLPAYLIDGLTTLCGKKPFMVNVQRRVQVGLDTLQYYTTKKWDFRNANQHALREAMSPGDRETFYTDIRAMTWDEFAINSVLGTREYVLKENAITLPQARKNLSRLKFMDEVTTRLFYFCVIWFAFMWFGSLLGLIDQALDGISSAIRAVPVLRVIVEPTVGVGSTSAL